MKKVVFPLYFLMMAVAVAIMSALAYAQEKEKIAVLLQCNQAENWCILVSRPDTGTEAQFGQSAHQKCIGQSTNLECSIVVTNVTGCMYVGYEGYRKDGRLPFMKMDQRTPKGFGQSEKAAKEDCPTCIFKSFGCGGTPATTPQA